jgi:predicted O-methyltransferase YrrM
MNRLILPKEIDFNDEEFKNLFFGEAISQEEISSGPFDGMSEITMFFKWAKNNFHISTAIETGSSHGGTSIFLAKVFHEAYTIEICDQSYERTKENLSQYSNAFPIHGNSSEVFKDLLPKLFGTRVMFYLDAHWNTYWPLLDELEMIGKTHKDNCVIVIDDIKVPSQPQRGYDSYAGNDLSYEYIEQKLKNIFLNYSIHYLLPIGDMGKRAKLAVLPI